jgi:hypothetical protein
MSVVDEVEGQIAAAGDTPGIEPGAGRRMILRRLEADAVAAARYQERKRRGG